MWYFYGLKIVSLTFILNCFMTLQVGDEKDEFFFLRGGEGWGAWRGERKTGGRVTEEEMGISARMMHVLNDP